MLDLRPVTFDIHTPANGDQLRANIEACRALGLPKVPTGKTIHIVATGPSARGIFEDFYPVGEHCAVNNALRLFTDRRLYPKFWAACDPQGIVASFIPDNPPEETVYLVSSKCHPDVFARLKNRNVLVWDMDDEETHDITQSPIPCGVSITLSVFPLLHRLGYSDFHTWGWDGCYMGGQFLKVFENGVESTVYANGTDHATPQPHHTDGDITVGIGEDADQIFQSTPAWLAETQDAALRLGASPYTVTIHGGGMTGQILANNGTPGVTVAR